MRGSIFNCTRCSNVWGCLRYLRNSVVYAVQDCSNDPTKKYEYFKWKRWDKFDTLDKSEHWNKRFWAPHFRVNRLTTQLCIYQHCQRSSKFVQSSFTKFGRSLCTGPPGDLVKTCRKRFCYVRKKNRTISLQDMAWPIILLLDACRTQSNLPHATTKIIANS